MSYVQLSEGGFPGGLPPRLVVPVLRSCQSPIWIWLVNYLHLHLHLHAWESESSNCSARWQPHACDLPPAGFHNAWHVPTAPYGCSQAAGMTVEETRHGYSWFCAMLQRWLEAYACHMHVSH